IFQGTIAFSASPADAHTSAGGDDVFVVKFDPAGNVLWSRSFGDILDDTPRAVATDASGNVFVTGDFEGTVNFGGGPVTSVDALDGCLVKLSSAGAVLGTK